MIDQATNGDGDSGRFEILRQWAEDSEERPTIVYHSHGPELAVVMKELVLANPVPHGYHGGKARYCACCDNWRMHGNDFCSECDAPFARAV